ncbi:putative oxidoreductase YrbE [Habropoda laboriosa]|uniref:Putative oxidoreductase YrbE n=1 Tax=Habropoda laboriosa TaxID=597456 RepID=A0A0L7QT04_9HYME|nr:putative oxidoreductase YrbE [Habropoda laboriosa]
MATIKFKEASSPYTKPSPSPPVQDTIYRKYLEDVTLKKGLGHPMVKVALFGVGRAGTIHLSNIIASPRLKLLYIVDDVESNRANMKEYWHLDDVTFLTSKQADRVYALEGKKAVLCEKPVAKDNVNTLKCYETAKNNGKPLFCAFYRRFDPSYLDLKERVRNGEIGHVHIIKTVSRDCTLPSLEYLKNSGGILHDSMVHDIDVITWILGEYPTKVSVQAYAHIPEIKAIGDYDTVAVSFCFPSGTLGMIDMSRNSVHGYDQRVEVFGPKGMITADNQRPLSVVTQIGTQGTNTSPIWYSFPSRFMNAYRRELDHFVNIALGKVESSVLPKETLAVSKIASACEESARTGETVKIQWTENELP